MDNFEEIVGVEETAEEEEESEEKTQHEEAEKREERKSSNVEVRNGKSDPGEEIYEDFTSEERWKEKEEEEEEENGKPTEMQNTLEIEPLNLKEKELSKTNKKEDEDLKKPTSLCLEKAEERLEADG